MAKGERKKASSDSGIAIGPILFVLAIMGVIAAALSSSIGSFSTAGVIDRISAEVTGQVGLIRAKINECNIKYGTDANGDGYPASDPTNGTLVSDLTCIGDVSMGLNGNLWTGSRPAQLPLPTVGFNPWYYMNAGDSGGRCFWIEAKNESSGITAGLQKVKSKFSSQEANYNPVSNAKKFIVFITVNSGALNAKCAP